MSHQTENGAPIVKLDFEDAKTPSIDFGMAPLSAMRLFDLLNRPAEDFWKDVRAADLSETPADRTTLELYETKDLKIIVARDTGIPTFAIEFESDAPIPAVEFSLAPAQALALMNGIAHLAEMFHWIDQLQAAGQRGQLN